MAHFSYCLPCSYQEWLQNEHRVQKIGFTEFISIPEIENHYLVKPS